MSTIAIGDIHGHAGALRDLLAQVEPELTRGDDLVFLGDYVDRGPDTRACIDDTITHGVLTAVRVPDGTVFQSRRLT